jgi:hypothetical protein
MSEANYVPQFTGGIHDGNLHVMLDVGLADVCGLSGQELKVVISSVKHLEVVNATLTSTVQQLTRTNSNMKSEIERLNSDVDSLNTCQAENLQELSSKVYNQHETMRTVDDLSRDNFQRLGVHSEELEKLKEKHDMELKQLAEKFDDLTKDQRKHFEKLAKLVNEHEEESAGVTDEEPRIALEDQLRIAEQSPKAIDLLTSHLFSTVWHMCSKNTFGEK